MQEYLNDMKDIQNDILNFLDNEKESEAIFLKIKERFSDKKYLSLRGLRPILGIIVNISINHHRCLNFHQKIERILGLFDDNILSILNNFYDELIVKIFRKNKRLILYLLKEKILFFDCPTGTLLSKLYKLSYFTPEIKEKRDKLPHHFYEELQSGLYEELPENFEDNRYNGENEKYICKLIREDLIEEFIIYMNKNNISFDQIIPESNYDTNELLKKIYNATLIEYSAFYGSIQIFQYLRLSGAKLSQRLLKFGVHSNNAEMIHLIEEYMKPTEIDIYKECYKESIKCHHNEIANYIKEQYLNDVDVKTLFDGIKYSNYMMYPDLNEDYLFFHLCQYDYKIALLYKENKEIYKNFHINLGETDFENMGVGYFGTTRCFEFEDEEDKNHDEYQNKDLVFKIFSDDDIRFKDIDNLMKIKYPSLLNPIGYDKCFSAHYRYDNFAVFFEYFEKGSLNDYLDKKKSLCPEQKYIILLGLAITIKHLHEKGIYLISLHPKNILLNENYYPVISDFTISKYTRRKVEQKKIELNDFKFDPYLAPESFENDIFNESTNAYSFALIAFRLLSNKPLFEGSTFKWYQQVLNGSRPYDRDLDHGIEEFLEVCWSPITQNRPSFEQIITMMTDVEYFGNYLHRTSRYDMSRVKEYLSNTFGDEYKDLIEKISNFGYR